MAAHRDPQPDPGGPAELLRYVQAGAVEGDRVVLSDHSVDFVTQNRPQVHRPEGDKDRGRLPRGLRERGVVMRTVAGSVATSSARSVWVSSSTLRF